MYIIKISDDSYKVILSKNDLSKYGEKIFDGGENSKEFFGDILSMVDTQGCTSSKLVAHAEFFEDKFGGGELFLCLKKDTGHNSKYVFFSKTIEDIIGVCNALSNESLHLSSRLIMHEGAYCLLLFMEKEAPLMPCILGEYGISGKASELYIWQLEEHGQVLIDKDAVEKINSVFTHR